MNNLGGPSVRTYECGDGCFVPEVPFYTLTFSFQPELLIFLGVHNSNDFLGEDNSYEYVCGTIYSVECKEINFKPKNKFSIECWGCANAGIITLITPGLVGKGLK